MRATILNTGKYYPLHLSFLWKKLNGKDIKSLHQNIVHLLVRFWLKTHLGCLLEIITIGTVGSRL